MTFGVTWRHNAWDSSMWSHAGYWKSDYQKCGGQLSTVHLIRRKGLASGRGTCCVLLWVANSKLTSMKNPKP